MKKLLLIFLVTAFLTIPTNIIYAAISHGSTVSYNGTATTNDITSVTVTGTDAVLIVKIAYKDNGGGEVESVVWDSAGVNQTLTQLGSESSNGDANSQIWYRVAPFAKTATVTITTTNATRMVAAASVYTGVHQSFPFRTAATASANGTDGTLTVDVTALNGEMVIDSGAQVSAGPDTVSSQSGTSRHDAAETGGGSDTRGMSQEIASTGATETMSYSMSSTDNWAIIAGALQTPSPTVVLNTADATDFDIDTTPTLEFTGTDVEGEDVRYDIQIDTVSTFDSQGGVMDTYNESNRNSLASVNNGSNIKVAQSFTGNGTDVTSVEFYLQSNNSPTGNATAVIYAHSGTYGTDSVPTGAALATSDNFDVSTLTLSFQLIEFTFSTPFSTIDGTKYVVSYEYNGGDSSNRTEIGTDNSSPTHDGNTSLHVSSWVSYSTIDVIFYVNGKTPLLDKVSGTDAGFANTVSGGDTDPFNSGEKADYDVQSGDALSTGTYYWRVKGSDPSGTNIYGDWATTRSFTVNTGSPPTLEFGTYRWFQNLDATEPGRPAMLSQATLAPEQGTPFRLRFNLHVGDADLTSTTTKLQFGTKNGAVCDSTGDETYSDVTTATAIRFYDNGSVADNASINSHKDDPRHSSTTGFVKDNINLQNYNDGTTDTTFSSGAINQDEDGLWDVSLVDFSATPNTSYCFLIVQTGGGLLTDYGSSTLPEIKTAQQIKVRLRGTVRLRLVRLR